MIKRAMDRGAQQLRIDHAGKADIGGTVFSGKIEMGQGSMTSQAQMMAEELGVSLATGKTNH